MYLRWTGYWLGLLINFNVLRLRKVLSDSFSKLFIFLLCVLRVLYGQTLLPYSYRPFHQISAAAVQEPSMLKTRSQPVLM